VHTSINTTPTPKRTADRQIAGGDRQLATSVLVVIAE